MLLLNNTRADIVVYRMVSKSLNVCCWNVNSLFNRVNGVRTNKLDDPLFLQSLNSGIIILTETHACKNDILTIDGYFCISNCRSEQPSRLRGGVAIFMKRNIKAGISIIDNSQDDMIWIKLCKNFFKFKKKIYLFAEFTSHQLLLAILEEQALIKYYFKN